MNFQMTLPDTMVVRHPNTLAVSVGGAFAAFNFDRDRYYGFDDIASDIWRRIEQPQRVEALIADLAKDYEGDETRITKDVLALLDHLQHEGLVCITDGISDS
ncbi:MAG TPA: PqqD family protein [Bryobacteraceae bacterium]|jgi:hypothetical protein|nr:PqqD family protein [Bryobacteraceae bacterium]